MQTVKNVFLWPSRSYIRKGLEIPLALYADLVWSKRRTLEIYLNIAELGPNIYGVEAASRHYFKKSAAKLSRREASLIAAALPNPAARNPAKPSRAQDLPRPHRRTSRRPVGRLCRLPEPVKQEPKAADPQGQGRDCDGVSTFLGRGTGNMARQSV